MNIRRKDRPSINYAPAQKERHSLKQKLMAAVANGDDDEAEELRLLLKSAHRSTNKSSSVES